MGFKESARVLRHSKASGTAKVLLLAIAHHDGPGGAWPSRDLLAEYANVDPKNVRRAIKKLVDDGELRVYMNAGGSDDRPEGHRPNRYVILVECPPECDKSEHHRMPRKPRVPAQRTGAEGANTPPQSGGERVQAEGANAPREQSTEPTGETGPGSKDQDYESPSKNHGKPRTAAEKADRRKLARFMANYDAQSVDTVWGWMRTGYSLSGRGNSECDRPGSIAAKKYALPTGDPHINEWQGWFQRHYLTREQENDRSMIPRTADDLEAGRW